MKAETKTNIILSLIGVVSGILALTTNLNWLIFAPFITSFAIFAFNLDIFHLIKRIEVEEAEKEKLKQQEIEDNIRNGNKYHL